MFNRLKTLIVSKIFTIITKYIRVYVIEFLLTRELLLQSFEKFTFRLEQKLRWSIIFKGTTFEFRIKIYLFSD